jgi:hypothetical protein
MAHHGERFRRNPRFQPRRAGRFLGHHRSLTFYP